MWPYLFGSGWILDVLVSAGFLSIVVAAIVSVLVRTEQPDGGGCLGRDVPPGNPREYEGGNLTPWEFARLISLRPVFQYNAAAPVKMPGSRRAPVH